MLGVFEPVGHVEFLQRALDAQLVFRHLAAGARLFQFVFWGLWQEKKNKQTKEERRSDAVFDGRGTPRPMVFLSFFFGVGPMIRMALVVLPSFGEILRTLN